MASFDLNAETIARENRIDGKIDTVWDAIKDVNSQIRTVREEMLKGNTR